MALMTLYILIGMAVVVFVGTGVQAKRRNRILVPLKKEIAQEVEIYRHNVKLKVRLWTGWSTKTLAHKELVVRTHSLQLSTVRSWLGRTMGGSEWYFKSAGTEISCDRKDGPTLSSYRNWIVLTGMDADQKTQLAIAETGQTEAIWNACIASGCTAISDPPGSSG
jgi:hypothetical protein